MSEDQTQASDDEMPEPSPRRLRLPPIVKPEDEGMGDVISRLSKSVGITPCGGCRERQQRLNAWLPFRRG
ncbi:hypothetical protein [Rhizobium sp. FY34]|uniref:hypothetical protein n=1 Tax=Rhizobium sp. FY34 TaxID=2562309 RepID=UPI0010C0316E|nr:hypothetical protein [Rhizobium sp. FY34]